MPASTPIMSWFDPGYTGSFVTPIYTSMMCLLLATGFLITPLPLFIAAAMFFMIGTEIRVRVEDALLASRFGEEFQAYRRAVSAYLPFSR